MTGAEYKTTTDPNAADAVNGHSIGSRTTRNGDLSAVHAALAAGEEHATTIRPARAMELPAVIHILATAMDDTEIARWLVPDRRERAIVYQRYFDLVTPWFFDHGTVYVTNNLAGAALWTRLKGRFEPDIEDYDRRLAAACGPATPRFVQLDKDMHAGHLDYPHHYLAFLAVASHWQGRGIGSRLLEAHHIVCDHDRFPAYLEATGRRNAALYGRHGYVASSPLFIGDGPPLYPMLRQPR